MALLGPLEMEHDGDPVLLRSPIHRLVIALLALRPSRVVSFDELIDAIWGDELPSRPLASLQIQVSRLRKILPAGSIETTPAGYRLRLEPRDVDVVRFDELVAEGRVLVAGGDPRAAIERFAAATSLWRGPPLTDLPESGALVGAVAALRERCLRAVEDLHRCRISVRENVGESVVDLERLTVDHPLRESITELLMRALYCEGRSTDALDRCRDLRRRLADDLGLSPSPAISQLELSILTHDERLASGGSASVVASSARPPSALTSFVGRAEESSLVLNAIADHRLVTVSGPGGIGKSRLVTELFSTLSTRFAQGAWFVPLADVESADRVPVAITTALGLDLIGQSDPVQTVLHHLESWSAVLVIDNCEQVGAAVADLVHEVMSACPMVSVISTSREPLQLQGERIIELRGLPVSDENTGDAVELFSERAPVLDDPLEPAAIARACRLVGGWPLAIELIAAQANRIDLQGDVEAFEEDLVRFETPYRRIPGRQVSLEATLDWSYRLLDHRLRRVYRTLGLFEGTITPDSVAAVLTEVPGGEDPWMAVLDLAERSLVVVDDGRQTASMLRPVVWHSRSMALDDPDETARGAIAYVEHHRQLVETADRELDGPDSGEWIRRIRGVHSNIRRAISLGLEVGRYDDASTIAARMGYFWLLDAQQRSGIEVIERMMTTVADEIVWTTRRDLVQAVGYLHGSIGNYQSALSHLNAALQLQEQFGDPARLATLNNLSNLFVQELRLEEALRCIEAAEELIPDWEVTVTPERVVVAQWSLSIVRASALSALGRHDEALRHAREAAEAVERSGSPHQTLLAAVTVAEALLSAGHTDDAVAELDRAAESSKGLDDFGRSRIEELRSVVAIVRGDLSAAEVHGRASLEHVNEYDRYAATSCLYTLAEVQLRVGDVGGARATTSRCLELVRDGGFGEFAPGAVQQAAVLLAGSGSSGHAATLMNAVSAMIRRTGCSTRPWASAPVIGQPGLDVKPDITPTEAVRLALRLIKQ